MLRGSKNAGCENARADKGARVAKAQQGLQLERILVASPLLWKGTLRSLENAAVALSRTWRSSLLDGGLSQDWSRVSVAGSILVQSAKSG